MRARLPLLTGAVAWAGSPVLMLFVLVAASQGARLPLAVLAVVLLAGLAAGLAAATRRMRA